MGCVETMKIADNKVLVKLISALAMGDGGLYFQSNGNRNAYFAMNMLAKHSDYIDLCQGILENIAGCRQYDRKVEGNRQPQIRLQSQAHPFFTKIRDRIYVDGYKSLDWHALEQLDWSVLAILYMCDGSMVVEHPNEKKGLVNPSYNITLNLKRLCYADQFLLKKLLKEKLDLEWNVQRQNQYHYLRLRSKDVDYFMENISCWVLDSFQYKVKSDFRTVGPQSRW